MTAQTGKSTGALACSLVALLLGSGLILSSSRSEVRPISRPAVPSVSQPEVRAPRAIQVDCQFNYGIAGSGQTQIDLNLNHTPQDQTTSTGAPNITAGDVTLLGLMLGYHGLHMQPPFNPLQPGDWLRLYVSYRTDLWIPSTDRDIRARQLIFHSEDQRHIPEIWERGWAMEMPDVATPYRVHGGVLTGGADENDLLRRGNELHQSTK